MFAIINLNYKMTDYYSTTGTNTIVYDALNVIVYV